VSRSIGAPPPPIRLHLLPEALDHAGEPRAALVVPPTSSRYDRRTVTLLFPSVAAALAAKRAMEGAGSLSITQGRRA
jgi:hypothetical protein